MYVVDSSWAHTTSETTMSFSTLAVPSHSTVPMGLLSTSVTRPSLSSVMELTTGNAGNGHLVTPRNVIQSQ